MANTTFNGPVRSENGFEEWDGSAWVPVGGGGGGGSVATVYEWTDPESTIVLDAPTQAGQVYTLLFPANEAGEAAKTFTISVAPMDGVDAVLFTGAQISYNAGAVSLGGIGSFEITDSQINSATLVCQIYYGGTFVTEGANVARFTVIALGNVTLP